MASGNALARKIVARARRAVYSPASWLRKRVRRPPQSVVRLGSHYGGWHVCDLPSLKEGFAILCGAGEDLTFDLALQSRYGCEIVIVDPTPRSIAHYNELRAAVACGKPYPVNQTDDLYDLAGVDFSRIRFEAVAVWSENATLKFWAPANPDHVSYSAVNLQRTTESITVPAKSVQSLVRTASDKPLALLKLDIEGAETTVIDNLLDCGPLPHQLLVEFDEIQIPTRAGIASVKRTVERLLNGGYSLAHFDGVANCAFVLQGTNSESPRLEDED